MKIKKTIQQPLPTILDQTYNELLVFPTKKKAEKEEDGKLVQLQRSIDISNLLHCSSPACLKTTTSPSLVSSYNPVFSTKKILLYQKQVLH